MEQLTGNQINYIIQKLMELNDGLTLSDLNELSLYIGIEEIDPIEYSTSNNSNYVLTNQFKKILNEIGQKVQDLDPNKIYDILKNIDYYYIDDFFTLMNDETKEKILNTPVNYFLRLKLIISIQDDDKKMKLIDSQLDSPAKVTIVNSIKDEEKRIQAIKKLEEPEQSALVKGLKSDENKIKVIKLLKSNEYKARAISYLNDDNTKLEMLQQIPKEFQKIIIKTIKDDFIKKSLIDKIENIEEKKEIIKTLKSDKLKLQYIEELNIPVDEIINFISSEEILLKLIQKNNLSETEIYNLVMNKFKKDENKIEALKKIQNEELKLKIILSIKDDNIKIQFLKNIKDEITKIEVIQTLEEDENKLKAMLQIQDRKLSINIRKSLKLEAIQKYRKEILEYEGITEDIEQKIQILQEMEKKNSELYSTIDFNMLDKDIITSFNKDQFEQLICYPEVERNIIELKKDNKRWKIFKKIFNTISKDAENWDIKLSRILDQLNSKEYQELIGNISEHEVDIEKLIKVMQSPNYFGIKTVKDLENYSQIKKEICDKIMNDDIDSLDEETLIQILQMNDLDQIRFAILQKLYGQDLESTKKIIEKYGQDLETLDQNSDEVIYVKALKKIMATNDINLLKKYYSVDRGLEEELVDLVAIENKLKHDYGKQFNKNLLQPQDLEKGEIEGTLKVGTNFRMIITSVAPYVKSIPKNFAEDWNRNNIKSRGFCCSYITNDMIGTAKIPHLCYGFSQMSEDALMLSGPTDIFSSTKYLEAKARSNEIYYSPENQVNNTEFMGIGATYNEMVFKREQEGQRKQPDYIIVFQENGRIPNMQKAMKAQKQWKEYGLYLPIIIVDKDECAKANKAEIENMIKNCESLKDYEKILNKINNNCKWREGFEQYKEQLETLKKTKEFMKKCYEETSAVQRHKVSNKITIRNNQSQNQIKKKDDEQK